MNGQPKEPDRRDAAGRSRAERARLDRIFGEVLPETTGDERGPSRGDDNDERLRRDVPPHHGG